MIVEVLVKNFLCGNSIALYISSLRPPSIQSLVSSHNERSRVVASPHTPVDIDMVVQRLMRIRIHSSPGVSPFQVFPRGKQWPYDLSQGSIVVVLVRLWPLTYAREEEVSSTQWH